MSLRDRADAAFLKLPPSLQRRTLHALRKYAPWEAGFDRRTPSVGGDLVVGPPDFVGVGVQKAGTSWWYNLIAEHPDVYHHAGFHKERHFFAEMFLDGLPEDGATEYHQWFPRPPGRVTGEWTPDYLHQHWVPPMLARVAPSARLLVLLRDPVERFRSGLDHHRNRGERLTPEVVGDAFARGLYGAQLASLARRFPASQTLVLQYEACVDDPRSHLAKTFAFLGLDDAFYPPSAARHVNATRGERLVLSQATRDRLAEAYRQDLDLLAASHPQLDLERWPSAQPRVRPGRYG